MKNGIDNRGSKSKTARIEREKVRLSAMSKEDLESELCRTLVGTLMPLIEQVVERRVGQWIEVIREGLEKSV